MFRTTIRLSSLAVCLLAACADSSGPDGDRKVSVLLTDAPGDILEAVVTIQQIYLQGGDDDGEGEEGAGRFILLDEPVTVDLLTLADDFMTLVDDAEIPDGQFGQLRFVVSGGYIKVEQEDGEKIFASSSDYPELPDGAEVAGDLQMPSFSTSGLKVNFQGGLLLEEETTLLVDFDVAESFGQETGSGRWVLHPVLKGSVVDEEVTPRRGR